MKRLSLVVLAALVLVGCSAIASFAGVKTILPDQLQLFKVGDGIVYEQCADYVRSMNTSQVGFTAQVKLPVGKKITKVIHYHDGSGGTALTSLNLYRTKMGENFESVASGSGYGDSDIIPVESSIYNPKIKSGYTYWVYVVSRDSYSYFKGIKIYYK